MHCNVSNYEGITEVESTSFDTCSLEGLSCKYYSKKEFVSDLVKHKGLSFMHINIASLSKHFESLNQLLNTFQGLKIIGVSETRINKYNLKSLNFQIQGYTLLCHTTEAAAGGTALCISDTLTFKPKTIYHLLLIHQSYLNLLLLKLNRKGQTSLLGVCINIQ